MGLLYTEIGKCRSLMIQEQVFESIALIQVCHWQKEGPLFQTQGGVE